MAELSRYKRNRDWEVICLVEAIANLKKRFIIQVVVVWKPCAECPGDGCTWSKCWARNLLTYLTLSPLKPSYDGHSSGHFQKFVVPTVLEHASLDSSPLNSGPGIYCWRVGGQLIYYLPYFISLNVKTVFYLIVIKNKKERLPLCIYCRQRQLSKTSAL